MTDLAALQVLSIDCQASAPDPCRGHLLEVGWAAGRQAEVVSELVKLPGDVALSERVLRVTGLSPGALAGGREPEAIWRLVSGAADAIAAEAGMVGCPTVAHFASFEERYLRWLHFHAAPEAHFRFRFLCTHRVARKLLPELPRKSLRAVAGYFGHALPESRRAADHVRATLDVWRCLVALLREREGVETLDAFHEWLRVPSGSTKAVRRSYPMPPERRRGMPARPGVYRMLRENGDVLYVGKATSLRERVSSYFHASAPHADHTLEMLSQARDVSWVETETALEAALHEADEIKRLEPPYNRALRRGARTLVYATPTLSSFADVPDAAHRVGPLPGSPVLAAVPALRELLAQGSGASPQVALALPDRYAPDEESFRAGLESFRRAVVKVDLLAFGARLWPREPEQDPDELPFELTSEAAPHRFAPEAVAERMGDVVRRASHLVRRSHWQRLLMTSVLVWRSRDGSNVALELEDGRLVSRRVLDDGEPAPPRAPSAPAALDLASVDRLTVLTKEMRRLVVEKREPVLVLSSGIVLCATRIERLLRWV